ncbi:patatin-like phospholipase family protein [Caballeronia ptereochthonis]|uniref:Patatin-like phospholipase n=1 Tax=Caballeronia ptereochthonis TaxID=1777144 RepID=A0A158AP08_9BURK|nr:patatin-like phospholipase family protein [Caballeronia ptereochthonis]SAK59542.1 patatin-like phospholipase [Caballeronia ptereochthonis]
MRAFVSFVLALRLLFILPQAIAQSGPPGAIAHAPRPKIALVLSGGGARGYSHIGVLKVLEELRVPVDVVVGTSMGAVIGGLYATGYSADDLDRKVSSVNLGDVAFDRLARPALPQTRREDELDYPIALPFGFDDSGKTRLPRGFVGANSFLALLQAWTASVPPNRFFDQLPLPFRAVATDLENGERVVFDHGSLPLAIRASMAAPGLFSPIEVDGRMLIDGGIVDNLPVDVARALGVDVVIAVHIGTPLRKGVDINSPADVAQQMVGILIGQNVKTQKDSLSAKDVLISPDLGDIKFTDFTRAREAIECGERAAHALSDRLAVFSASPADYETYRAEHRTAVTHKATRIDEIQVDSTGKIPPEFVRGYLNLKDGDSYDAPLVNSSLAKLQATGYFEAVSHEFIDGDGANRLRVRAREKSWGPNFLLFGIGLSTDFEGGGGFEINIGHRRPWITASGLEWRNDLKLGDEQQRFHTELRQPVFGGYGFYVAPYAEVSQKRQSYFGDSDDTSPASHPMVRTWRREAKAGLDFAMPLSHLGEIRIGAATSRVRETPDQDVMYLTEDGAFGAASVGSVSWSQSYGRAQLIIDQLDDALFPRSGYLIRVDAQSSFGGDSDNAYRYLHARATGAASTARHSFIATAEVGASKYSGAPFSLGGFRHLAAYGVDQFSGNYLLYGQLTYQFRVASPNGQFVRDLYLGTTAEAGNATLQRQAINLGNLKKSFSVFLGGTTAFGPAYLGFAMAPGGIQSIYLQFGADF